MRELAHSPIDTKGIGGNLNGKLIPIYNKFDRFYQVDVQQVYVTTCEPGCSKGPHLHLHRWGYFTCIIGNVRIVAKYPDGYRVSYAGADFGYQTVEIPPGIPCRIDNIGVITAYIINATAPAWTPDNQDEFPVEGWDYD